MRDLPVRASLLADEGTARSRREYGPTRLKNIAEPIRVYSIEVGLLALAKAGPAPTPEKSPPRLSMVVLPFVNIGGDREHKHFVDGDMKWALIQT